MEKELIIFQWTQQRTREEQDENNNRITTTTTTTKKIVELIYHIYHIYLMPMIDEYLSLVYNSHSFPSFSHKLS